MEYDNLEFEQERLAETIELAKQQMTHAKQYNEKKKEEIIAAKKEMRENGSHSIGSLWSSDDFEALAELNQYANAVTDRLVDYEETQHKISILEKIIASAYFARINFKFEEEDSFERVYIGRASLKEEDTHEIKIYDWRSPIASVFYRFVTGDAYYDAPSGRIHGEVNLKRQYEIQNGNLEYFFDSDVQIVDEFLKKLLSQNTSIKMKAIVETIQRDQDVVIRDMKNDLMMVQGVAGSGKTSIALHRAAYLMYEGLTTKIEANNIIIISPNTLFEQYISNVLPELGESNIASIVFEEIAASVLKRGHIQSRNQFLEALITAKSDKKVMKESMEWKTSTGFSKVLDQYIHELAVRGIVFEDVYYEGKCIATGKELRNRICRHTKTPLGLRLKQLEEYVLELLRESKGKRLLKSEEAMIKNEMHRFTELSVIELYSGLFADREYLYCLMGENHIKDNIDEIVAYTNHNLGTRYMHYDDAIALTYLSLKIYGSILYKDMKQVVIDEAQDYYPLQYEIFKILFPNAKFTILGDMNQTLEKKEDISFYGQIGEILSKKRASLVTMDKSFRCTTEILNYSLKFIEQSPEIKSFNRNGDEPQVFVALDQQAYLAALKKEVGLCKEKGYQSIGLICKTEEDAEKLYKSISDKIEVKMIKNGSKTELKGVFIIPVYMSKGLEFDAVLICDANAENYRSNDDKNLLYIGCTRALHRLNLFAEGAKSPLL